MSSGNIPFYSIQCFRIFCLSLCNVILLHAIPISFPSKHPWVSSVQSPIWSTLWFFMEQKSILYSPFMEQPRNLAYPWITLIAFHPPHTIDHSSPHYIAPTPCGAPMVSQPSSSWNIQECPFSPMEHLSDVLQNSL